MKAANAKARAFLKAFRITNSITKAAAAVPMERDLHYRWLKESKGYALAFENAKLQAGQILEDEAVRRAHQGVFKPNTWKGQFCYEQKWNAETKRFEDDLTKQLGVTEYSDALLVTMLKGAFPDKYRERGLFEGKKGETLAIAATLEIKVGEEKLKHLDDDELASLIAISRKFAAAEHDGGSTETPGAE